MPQFGKEDNEVRTSEKFDKKLHPLSENNVEYLQTYLKILHYQTVSGSDNCRGCPYKGERPSLYNKEF